MISLYQAHLEEAAELLRLDLGPPAEEMESEEEERLYERMIAWLERDRGLTQSSQAPSEPDDGGGTGAPVWFYLDDGTRFLQPSGASTYLDRLDRALRTFPGDGPAKALAEWLVKAVDGK